MSSISTVATNMVDKLALSTKYANVVDKLALSTKDVCFENRRGEDSSVQ